MITVHVQKNLAEVVTYNLPHLPIQFAISRLSSYFQMAAPCHWHGDWEFLVALEGSMGYYVNGRHYLLSPGTGIFVNQNQMHYGYSPDGSDCLFLCLVISPSIVSGSPYIEEHYIRPLLSDASSDVLLLNPENAWQKEILSLLNSVYKLYERREDGCELEISAACQHLTALLYKNTVALHGIRTDHDRDTVLLTNMVGFIQKSYQHRITLEEIAAAGSVCKTKCSQLFKKAFSQTPIEYLTSYRLQKSIFLMGDPSKTITEIALLCGFCSASYYVETFRKLMRVTPSEFRKEHAAYGRAR